MPPLFALERLALAVAFGMAIGVERQWHHKTAGVKTSTLVALGASAFALVAVSAVGPTGNPAQVLGAIVTGIGFIGAGVIIRRGGSVQGVNTAATLWATASVGALCGTGHEPIATCVFVLVLVVQFITRWLALWLDRRVPVLLLRQNYVVEVTTDVAGVDEVRRTFGTFASAAAATLIRQAAHRTGHVVAWSAKVECAASAADFGLLEEQLLKVQGVTRVEARRDASEDGGG